MMKTMALPSTHPQPAATIIGDCHGRWRGKTSEKYKSYFPPLSLMAILKSRKNRRRAVDLVSFYRPT